MVFAGFHAPAFSTAGARGGDVYRMVLRQRLAPVALGLIAGVAVALAVGRILSSLLFQVSPTDPFTIGAVTILLAAGALVACSVSRGARHACGTDEGITI